MGKMLVYHGSYTEIKTPKIIIGRNTKDFGNGFYCTIIKEQAERWAKRYDTPKINVYSFLIDEALDILEFKSMTDDQIYNYVSDYMEGVITREQFWILAKFRYPTHQINFCTDHALKCLHYEYCEEVVQ